MSQYVNKIRTKQGDLQINYEALANLPDLPAMISNPNLLINSDFRNPVNQRGQTKYAPSKNILSYTIDRWGIFPSVNDGEGHSITVNNGYITFANTNENMSAYFIQHLEVPLTGTYTLSVKVKSATKAFSVSYRDNGTVYRAMTLNEGINSATINCTALNFIRFDISGAASVDLEWVKLEVGPIATIFSPRFYAEELMLCRRYFCVVVPSLMILARQRFDGTTSYFAGFPYPSVMRVLPNVTYESKTSGSSVVLTGQLGLTHDEFGAKYFSIQGDYSDIELTYMSLDAEIY
jgi:hypothetical protein